MGSAITFGEIPHITFQTTLPGSPADGDLTILTDSVSAPTYQWLFRYVAAKSSNKWIFIGGPPLSAQSATDGSPEGTSSTTYTDLSTSGPAIAVPVDGDYLISISCIYDGNTGVGCAMSYAIGGTAASDNDRIMTSTDSNSGRESGYRRKKKSLTAVTLTTKYRNFDSAGTARFYNRYIEAIPIAIGG